MSWATGLVSGWHLMGGITTVRLTPVVLVVTRCYF
jgi:hypothetical protein